MSFFQEQKINYFVLDNKSFQDFNINSKIDPSIIYISDNQRDIEEKLVKIKKLTPCSYFILNGCMATDSIKNLSIELNAPLLVFPSLIDDASNIINFIKSIFGNNNPICVDYHDFSEIHSGEECYLLEIDNESEKVDALSDELKKIGRSIKSATFLFHTQSISSAHKKYAKAIDYLNKIENKEPNSLFSMKNSKNTSRTSVLLTFN